MSANAADSPLRKGWRALILLLKVTISMILVYFGLWFIEYSPYLSEDVLTPGNGTIYTSYNGGITCNSLYPIKTPKSIAQIQKIVKHALRKNLTVKAFGSLHSASDIICTEGVPISMSLIDHFAYDKMTKRVTVGAGMKVFRFMEALHLEGRSLAGVPAYGDITIGGAIATGAHGSSLNFPTTISDQIVGLKVIDGLGNLRTISSEEGLSAFRAHLGLLGIVVEVVLRTVPQFKIQFTNYPTSAEVLEDTNILVKYARKNDFFQFWWYPTAKQVILSKGNIVPTNTSGECQTNFIPPIEKDFARFVRKVVEILQEFRSTVGLFLFQTYTMISLFTPVFGRAPFYSEGDGETPCETEAVGYSYKMLANRCEKCPWSHGSDSFFTDESEMVIPVEELAGAMVTMKSILDKYPIEFYLNGIFFRFITPSNGWMTLNRRRESVGIEWVTAIRSDKFTHPKYGLPVIQALSQALVQKHKGRSHWGKNGLYYSSPEMIHLQHNKYHDKFVEVMKEMDPQGVFLNDFGRRVRFGDEKMTVESRMKYCAMTDHCICQTDKDCGETGSDYKCGNLMGYNVCMGDFREIEKEGKSAVMSSFMGVVQSMQRFLVNIVY